MLSGRKGQPFATVKPKRMPKKKKVTKGPGILEENRNIQFVYTLGGIVYGYKWSRENLRACIFLLEDDGPNATLYLSKMIEYAFSIFLFSNQKTSFYSKHQHKYVRDGIHLLHKSWQALSRKTSCTANPLFHGADHPCLLLTDKTITLTMQGQNFN
jgi:hypothetical protein